MPQWLSYIQSVHHRSIELGLERVAEVATRLGLLPVRHKTITVAGTNGKGSSVALLETILIRAGHHVGSYTSPHLVDFRERIQINGEWIPQAALCSALEQIEAARGDIPLTYFEFSTLAALWWFREQQIDVALLETGMGGRLDAVNIIDADTALITNIDIDHAQWLGPDRESIALEKAGIMRSHKPAVCSDPRPPGGFLDYAETRDIPLHCLHRDFGYELMEDRWHWQSKGFPEQRDLPLPVPLHQAQLDNAAGVLMVLSLIRDHLPVKHSDIVWGLRAGLPAGRGQLLLGAPSVILDVSHNTAATRVLADLLARSKTSGTTHAVFAALADKPVAEMVRVMAPQVDAWYVCDMDTERALPAAELSDLVGHICHDVPVASYSDPRAAFNAAKSACVEDDRICVFGSFYVVGDILAQREQLGI